MIINNIEIDDHIKSIAIVGMQKNAGKTVTFNWLIDKLKSSGKTIALTSIGIDGETVDQVTKTKKPEIIIYKDMLFLSSEKHYSQKKFLSEILCITDKRTALGRLIFAKALEKGKIILSGPPSVKWVKDCIEQLKVLGAKLVLVDGALFRLSSGSPIVTDSLIIATGLALSLNLKELIKKTVHITKMAQLEKTSSKYQKFFANCLEGVWRIVKDKLEKVPIQTAIQIDKQYIKLIEEAEAIFIAGGVTNKFLNELILQKIAVKLVIRDFTKIFFTSEVYNRYIDIGGNIKVIKNAKLLAITVNPYSPTGYNINTEKIIYTLKKYINIPVINVKDSKN